MEITQAVEVPVITIKAGIWEIDLSKEDVTQMYHDLVFLQNAVLSLLNPEVCDKGWDHPFTSEQYKELLKEYFTERELNYSNEFLKAIFK